MQPVFVAEYAQLCEPLCMSTYVEYDSLKDDWQYTEGVIEGGFAYGPDRNTAGLPAAPSAGVRMRLGNPTQNQIAVAASTISYDFTDRVVTIWQNTLRVTPADPASLAVEPVQGDKVTARGKTYIVAWVKLTVYDTQWLCYLKESQL